MRIISGKYKGKRLKAPKRLPVRPTTDMAKEALFNILNNSYYFEDLAVLDLFSGTGNISFEFASRGAANIKAIDQNTHCVQFIAKTAKELNFPIEIVKSDAFKFLEHTTNSYDLIFADPPYNLEFDNFSTIVKLVFSNDLLIKEGLLIIEHSEQTDLSKLPYFSEKRKYGSSIFSFFKN